MQRNLDKKRIGWGTVGEIQKEKNLETFILRRLVIKLYNTVCQGSTVQPCFSVSSLFIRFTVF